MNLINKFIKENFKLIITQIIIIFFLVFIIFEIYLRINKFKYHTYGWFSENIIQNKIDKCKNSTEGNKFLVFGDSFVEYYLNQKHNLTKLLERESENIYCNFGLSGSNIPSYFNRLDNVLKSNINDISGIIVFLYEGNDFSDFLVKDNSSYVLERKYNIYKKIFAKSFFLNFIYREIYKPLFNVDSISEENLLYKNFINYNISDFKNRFNQINKTDLKLFSQGKLNRSWLSIGLTKPDYFLKIYQKESINFQLKEIDPYLKKVEKIKNKLNIPFYIFIIPHVYYISDKAKKNWSDVFKFNNYEIDGPINISKYLENNYDYIFYIDNLLYEDFITLDGHLFRSGNKKIADFVLKKMR